MDEDEIELLVRQIQFTNQAWHTHQAVFGSQTPEARALRSAKNRLQRMLLDSTHTLVTLVADGEHDAGVPTYHLEVRLRDRRLSACHMPRDLVDGAATSSSELPRPGDRELDPVEPANAIEHSEPKIWPL